MSCLSVTNLCTCPDTFVCGLPHSHECHDPFIYICKATQCAWQHVICRFGHSVVCNDSCIRVPWLIHACAVTHSYVCHDSTCMTCLISECGMLRSYVWCDSFICWTCKGSVNLCDMTHSYVWHVSRVPWLIHICDMSHVCHDSFIYVTCLYVQDTQSLNMCAMTHSYMSHVSLMRASWPITRTSHTCHYIHIIWHTYHNIYIYTHARSTPILTTHVTWLIIRIAHTHDYTHHTH